MINIISYSEHIKRKLLELGVEKFKVFIRINFNIDVYIFSSKQYPQDYYRNALLFLDGENYIENDTANREALLREFKNLRININVFPLEDADDPFHASLFSNGTNDIDYGPRFRFNSFLQGNKKSTTKGAIKPPVVTFYSYKGGMGRTTSMVAYAMDLAINQKKRVVIIDCDLEAPGYLNFFDLTEHEGLKSGRKNGLVEFLSDTQFCRDASAIDINNYLINVGYSNEKNAVAYESLDKIWLIPAGNLNEDFDVRESQKNRASYLEGLSRLNLSNTDSIISSFELLFEKLASTVEPDIILIDSRTGFNDIFGTIALHLSDYVVGFFGYSRQTIPGLITLLNDYYKPEHTFKLYLVSSILPNQVDENWANNKKDEIYSYINYIGGSDAKQKKAVPNILDLHRNEVLEKIGTGDGHSDADFVEMVRKSLFEDYRKIFGELNSALFPKKEVGISENTPSGSLRQIILKHLNDTFKSVTNFAEDTEIREELFFYRGCLNELFQPSKFLIKGYKGTGKTYLYKALANKNISTNIQKKLNEASFDLKVINILPISDTEKGIPFKSIAYSQIEDPEYYFNAFWQIHTWNSILLDPLFEDIKNSSKLASEVLPIAGNETLFRFDHLIKGGLSTLMTIEEDIAKVNNYLSKNNIKLFVLYDRLDTYINPLRWNMAVSPLINYWRESWSSYSNIMPKIFVRTDLFERIQGTNTARLENNIISLEWTIGEIFGYFFKLVFSSKQAADAYWAIAKKVKINSDYIRITKTTFDNNNNQFKTFDKPSMDLLINVFFGKEVNPQGAHLGRPWDYFKNTLANADGTSISLRPFINTLAGNAIGQALETPIRYVTEILSPEIYASRQVRITTSNTYFNDLTQDEFSQDLQELQVLINSEAGKPFRYKELNETQFKEMLSIILSRLTSSAVVKSEDDFKKMLYANGIMAEKPTPGGKYYRFAPLYWYGWGLANSSSDVTELHQPKPKKAKPKAQNGKDLHGVYNRRSGKIETPDNRYYDADPVNFIDNDIKDGDNVVFDIISKPHQKRYFIAINVRKEK